MARRLARGSFSPSKKSSSNANDGSPKSDETEKVTNSKKGVEGLALASADGVYEEEDDENVDLTLVRTVLGENFKLDTDLAETKDKPNRSVSFTGVGDSPASSVADDSKSPADLMAKIEKLEIKLKQAELDYSAEKARRKKSSRSTLKLAKEINKRTVDATAKQKAIDKLTTANAALEAKLSAMRKELEERISTGETSSRDHHQQISEAQQKYRDACLEHDRRMSEMTQAHNQEVEALRRQLAVANKDLDMLRAKLVKLEVQEAERIAEHTVYTGIDPTEAKKLSWKKQKKLIAVGSILAVIAWFYQCTGFSMDAICGPAVPGTKLNKLSKYEAPWWAPQAMKPSAFALCGDRRRVSVSWTPTSGEVGRVLVETLDGPSTTSLFDRKALSAIVKYDRLDIVEKKGKVESIKLPWV